MPCNEAGIAALERRIAPAQQFTCMIVTPTGVVVNDNRIDTREMEMVTGTMTVLAAAAIFVGTHFLLSHPLRRPLP